MTAATDRLPRLLALVPYLLAHPGARVDEVAELFGVTDSQLRKDLNLIFVCGLPGYGPGELMDVSLEGDTITLSNADTIARPLRLSADEALALIVAVRTLADVPGLPERDALDRVRAKLESAAGAVPADVAVSVEAVPEVLATVRRALAAGRRLHLGYHVPARDEATERDVDPMRVLLVDGHAYLEGWCRRAEAVRLFRLDRVLDVSMLDVPAQVPPQAQPRDLDEGLFAAAPDDMAVTLALAPAAAWVGDYYPCERVEEDADGGLRVRLRTPHTDWVRRLLLRLGPAARVVDPPQLAEQVRADARRALAAYAPPARTVKNSPPGAEPEGIARRPPGRDQP